VVYFVDVEEQISRPNSEKRFKFLMPSTIKLEDTLANSIYIHSTRAYFNAQLITICAVVKSKCAA